MPPADPCHGVGRGAVVKDLLVLGANAPEMELLRARIARMGYRVVAAKTPDQAHGLMRVGGTRIGAVIVPAELPAVDLRTALDALRRLVPAHEVTWLGAGRDPGRAGRERMRGAGVQLDLFDPIDLHTLRFQVNRALAGPKGIDGRRRTVRAPADWPVTIRAGARKKEGRLYSVSATGAFVAIDQPSVVRAEVTLELGLPGSVRLAASGRVAMTNVPGNLTRRSLPFGMGVQFEQLSEGASVALLVYAQDRFRSLAL
jgi:PilZ domain-containing protein